MAKKSIAITGGIGSGKSTLLSLLQEKGYTVFSCDEIYQSLLYNPNYIQKIKSLFPTAVKNNTIDKIELGKIVFENDTKRQQLNEVAHPSIMQELFEQIKKHDGVVFSEVPLLFEGEYENDFDGVIVVMREKQQRVKAIAERNGISTKGAEQRMLSQFDYDNPLNQDRLIKNNIFLVYNNGSMKDLENSLCEVLQKIV